MSEQQHLNILLQINGCNTVITAFLYWTNYKRRRSQLRDCKALYRQAAGDFLHAIIIAIWPALLNGITLLSIGRKLQYNYATW